MRMLFHNKREVTDILMSSFGVVRMYNRVSSNMIKILSLFCAGLIAAGSAAAPVAEVFAAATEEVPPPVKEVIPESESEKDEKQEQEDGTASFMTGSQLSYKENEVDVDADIRSEVQSDIEAEWVDIHVSSPEDIVGLADKCRLDTWSVNKRVILENDISMAGVDFKGIPSFGGVFDGRGHTVSELNIDEDRSYTGFFVYLQETAIVRNLNVRGVVSTDGGRYGAGGIAGDNYGQIVSCSFDGKVSGGSYIGGIAGFNELSGSITDTVSRGEIGGSHFTGGIAGENIGNISRCLNFADVNTIYKEQTFSVQDINLETYVTSIFGDDSNEKRESAATVGSVYDTGGIAGVSIGVIMHCVNDGAIGYDQVGYNCGGIAGRQSGYIFDCTNNGTVLGRKDVGGIVGQAEPYVTIDLSHDIAAQLNDNIQILHDLIGNTLEDAGEGSDVITDRLSVIQKFTGQALGDTRYLAGDTVGFVNGVTGSVSEAFSRIDYILDEASKKDGAVDQTVSAAENVLASGRMISESVKDLSVYDYLTPDEKKEYDENKSRLEEANNEFDRYKDEAKKAFRNYYMWVTAKDSGKESDLVFVRNDTGDYTFNISTVNDPAERSVPAFNWDSSRYPADPDGDINEFINTFGVDGGWCHHIEPGDGTWTDAQFPAEDTEADHEKHVDDTEVKTSAEVLSKEAVQQYANYRYAEAHGTLYAADVAGYAAGMTELLMKHVDEMSTEVRSDVQKAVSYMNSSVTNIREAGSETKRITSTVGDMDTITLPQLSNEYRAHTSSLADNLQGMNDNFGVLNTEINSSTGALVGDLSDVNDQFNKIMMLYSDAIDGVLDRDYSNVFEDESLGIAETCTDATIDSCVNKGYVYGDIDTAGIAGTMAIEYDFDPESDVTGISDAELNTTFITKCVLRADKNLADLKGKKNYVAGICGLQEMGTVTGCENYADITSDSGQYAGGIAGQSLSYILKSAAKGEITASSYAGGIAGDGTHIYDSLAAISVNGSDEWYGAIAGHVTDEGKVRNNYFIGDELAGIDRVSYSHKAEPISFRQLDSLEEEGMTVPEDFKRMRVAFIVKDGDDLEIIDRRSVEYGDSVSYDSYPEAATKQGYYVRWEVQGVGSVTKDTKIEGEYIKNLTTLAGSEIGENGQSEILVDGMFRNDDEIVVESFLSEINEVYDKSLVVNSFSILIPDDGSEVHTVRYALDEESVKLFEKDALQVLSNENGSWVPVGDPRLMGRYMLFEVKGNYPKLQIRLESYKKRIIRVVVLVVIGFIAAIVIAVLIIRTIIKRRAKIRKAAHIIVDKTREVTQNMGSQELFYHAEEDRFGNEVVPEEPEEESAHLDQGDGSADPNPDQSDGSADPNPDQNDSSADPLSE